MSIFSKIQRVEKLSPSLRNLYMHKVIRDVGVSLVGMFGPIFLYVIGGSLEFVLVLYGAICVLVFFVVPVFGKVIRFFSMHVLMIIGVVFLITYFLLYYFLAQAGHVVWGLVISLVVCAVVSRQFYWISYHVDFARFVSKHHRGRQMSFLAIVVSLVGIVLPIFSAFVISKFGFSVLFVLAIVVVSVSVLPMFFIPRTRERYSFGYFESFRKLFSKHHRKTNLAYMADGFQGHIGSIVWPIFIFVLLKGEYVNVGLISAGIILVSCVLRYVMGELADKRDKKKLIKTGSLLYSIGWVFKALVFTGLHVFLVGVYHDFMAIFFRTPFDVLMYEIAADEGHYVDEFTILRDMAMNLGRVLMVLLSLVILYYLGVVWVFVLGAGVSLLMNTISKEEFRFKNV